MSLDSVNNILEGEDVSRRQILAGIGTGAAAVEAGCMGPDAGADQPANGQAGNENGGGSSSESLDDYKDWISADATDFQYIDISGVEEHFQIFDSTNEGYVSDTGGTNAEIHWNPYSLAAVGLNDVRDVEETVSIKLDDNYDAARVMTVPDAEITSLFQETGDTHQGYTLFQSDEGRAIAQDGDIVVAADNQDYLEKMLNTRHGDEPAVMGNIHDQQYFRQLVDALNEHGGQGQIINGREGNPLTSSQRYGNNINWGENRITSVTVYRNDVDVENDINPPEEDIGYTVEGNIAIETQDNMRGLSRVSNGFLQPNYD